MSTSTSTFTSTYINLHTLKAIISVTAEAAMLTLFQPDPLNVQLKAHIAPCLTSLLEEALLSTTRTARKAVRIKDSRKVARAKAAIASRKANRPTKRNKRVVNNIKSRGPRPTRIARINDKAARRIARANVALFIIVATAAPIALPVHGCALPKPILKKDKEVVTPLPMRRPTAWAVPVNRAPKAKPPIAIAVEVVVEPTTPTTAPRKETLAERETRKAAMKEWQAKCVAEKAAYKKKNPHIKRKGANPKGKKNNAGGGGNTRKQNRHTPPAPPSFFTYDVTSLGNIPNIICGPTADDNYGWKPTSDEWLTSFFYGEEVIDATATSTVVEPPSSELPAELKEAMVRAMSYDHVALYDDLLVAPVVCMLGQGGIPKKTTGAAPLENARVVVVNKAPVNPSKALTEILSPLQRNTYEVETLPVPFTKKDDKKGTLYFNGKGGTFMLMRYNGELFIGNSHIRWITESGKKEEYEFHTFIERILDASVEEANEAFSKAYKEMAVSEYTQEEYDEIAAAYTENNQEVPEDINPPMSHEAILEKLKEQGIPQPKKYIVLVQKKMTNENEEVSWGIPPEDELKYAQIQEEYEAKGYIVLPISPCLKIGSISAENIRINGSTDKEGNRIYGDMPCDVINNPADIRDKKIQEWTPDNVYMGVQKATYLADWIDNNASLIKGISFSFDTITVPVRMEHDGIERHEFSFTGEMDTAYPTWIMTIWTKAPEGEQLVSKTVVHKVLASMTPVPTKAQASQTKPGLSLMESIRRINGQGQAKALQRIGKGVPPMKVLDQVKVESVEGTNPIGVSKQPNIGVVPDDTEMELFAVPQSTSSKPPTTSEVTVREDSELDSLSEAVSHFRITNNQGNMNTSVRDEDEDAGLCQTVALPDLGYTKVDGELLFSLLVDALHIEYSYLPEGDPNLGSFELTPDGIVRISTASGLTANQQCQVIIHELIHYMSAMVLIEDGTFDAVAENWVNEFGIYEHTPEGSSLEEQFAYRFMSMKHDLGTICQLFRAVSKDDIYDIFDMLEGAAKGMVEPAQDMSAPIKIVIEGQLAVEMEVAVDPVSAALSALADRVLLVAIDTKGTLPHLYSETFPELKSHPAELGTVVQMETNSGLAVYGVCCLKDADLNQVKLWEALAKLNEIAGDDIFVCESDLGFGYKGHKATILGQVRRALGKDNVKTLSTSAVQRFVKEHAHIVESVIQHPTADLSMWSSGLMQGTAITVVPKDTYGPNVVYGGLDAVLQTTYSIKLQVLNEDNSIDYEALAQGIAEIESIIETLPMPIHCYTCQAVALRGLSKPVVQVEYRKGAFLNKVKVGILSESPNGQDLQEWYGDFTSSLRNVCMKDYKGVNGFMRVQELSYNLYSEAFSAMGLDPLLALYAISPVPRAWLKGIVLVVPGKNYKGFIEKSVDFQTLIDKQLLEVLVKRGIPVYAAEYAYNKETKQTGFMGIDKIVHGIRIPALPEGMEGRDIMQYDGAEFANVIGSDIPGVVGKMVFTLPQQMQKHLLDTIQWLVDTHGVGIAIEYMDALLPGLVKKPKTLSNGNVLYGLSVYSLVKAGEYYLEFSPAVGEEDPDSPRYLSPRHCTVHTGKKEFSVNAITNLSGYRDALYEGVTVAIGLAISMASGRKVTQDTIEGYLAGCTNLWARDENYGRAPISEQLKMWRFTDTLKVIIDNSGKTISATPNKLVDAKGVEIGKESGARWPFHMPSNASLDLAVMHRLMEQGELVICDKYGMERIIVGDGARAMLATSLSLKDAEMLSGYEEGLALEIALDKTNGGMIYTVCWPTDKASKTLNRPSQFHGASQADGWNEALERCPLQTKLSEEERSGVHGFKRTFIYAVTDFLSHGSGAATQHRDASFWSILVKGTMRTTLEWHQVPAVQDNLDANGNPRPGLRCHSSINGPVMGKGPKGYNAHLNREVQPSEWFCKTIAEEYLAKYIEAAMYTDSSKKYRRVYGPGERMVVAFKDMYDKGGNKIEGFFPTGQVPGIPSSEVVLFSNELGKQDVVITGYRFLPMQQGESLQIILEYATVMDTSNIVESTYSGVKIRGIGVKFIISHDSTINYLGYQAPYNGVNVDLQELYLKGAIHVTSEGMKGNYALMQSFASAHGNAHVWGPRLYIDEYLMNGDVNPHYEEGSPDMVSDMTDKESYFYQWVRNNTRTIRMQKTLSVDDWTYIKAANKNNLDENGNLPGVVEVDHAPWAISWDSKEENNVTTTDVETVTLEYDVQVFVGDYWCQVEVAPPIACLGEQGLTTEQTTLSEVFLKDHIQKLWERNANNRKGVNNAVLSAEIHALVEAGKAPDGIFRLIPKDLSHRSMLDYLLYKVTEAGLRYVRPAKDVYILLAHIFGGAGIDNTAFLKQLYNNQGVAALDVVNGKVVEGTIPFDFSKVTGIPELVNKAAEKGKMGAYCGGLGFTIYTKSQQEGSTDVVTYVDPTVFLQLGAFQKRLVAANPQDHKAAKVVTGAATGIVNDIYANLVKWSGIEFWVRTGTEGILHATNSMLRGSMMAWIGVNTKQPSMMRAPGVLNRLARIMDAGIAGKICTGIGPQYAHEVIRDDNGKVVGKLPVAIIHPDCMLAEGLNHGDIIGVGRTPVASLAFCVVKFSRTYGRVGYISMSFVTWAMGNNGDTDGDPCNRIRVGRFLEENKWLGISYAEAIKLNQHPLGMGGYSLVCGDDPSTHDCAEFVSFGVWGKKCLNEELVPDSIKEWAKSKGMKIKGMEALVCLILPSVFVESAEKVSQHYRANVGIGYGWCSAYSAHLKEKHSYLEAVVDFTIRSYRQHILQQQKEIPVLPSVEEVMDILLSGEIYDAITPKTKSEVPHSQIRFQYGYDEYCWLSNMYSTYITYEGLTYNSVEAAFHAQKDPSKKYKFTGLGAFEASKLGTSEEITIRPDWEAVKIGVMKDLLEIKFSDKELMAKLKATGFSELVHASTSDKFWGMDGVEGENILGKLLMGIRNNDEETFVNEKDKETVCAKYPAVTELYKFKLDPKLNKNPMDLVKMGQHIGVMLEATAWLWRFVYEGLGLSGYSESAATFFFAFTIALRNKGVVADTSWTDENGKKVIGCNFPNPMSNNTPVEEFISKHWGMSLPVAKEMVAAFALYNGYRAIERGRHIPNPEDKKDLSTWEVCELIYNSCMSGWADTTEDEFKTHAVLAGVFRRAGQGTSGVSIDDSADEDTAAVSIFAYAAKELGDKLAEYVKGKKVIACRNPMLNELLLSSVSLYTRLEYIATKISGEDYYA